MAKRRCSFLSQEIIKQNSAGLLTIMHKCVEKSPGDASCSMVSSTLWSQITADSIPGIRLSCRWERQVPVVSLDLQQCAQGAALPLRCSHASAKPLSDPGVLH